jgi:hypothetical protein
MAKRWTFREIELLKRYYPDYKVLVELLRRRNKAAIKLKASSLELLNSQCSLKEKKHKIFLPKEIVEVKTKQPSHKEILLKAEENEEKALIALRSAKDIAEWTRCLDTYRYWTVRHEQIISSRYRK